MRIVGSLVFAVCITGIRGGDFWWYDKPQTLPDRQTMVHLFEWKWTDIANECEIFLAKYGYGAVQVSPPMEHITLTQDGDMPWWVRYQPVSYKLESRSGTEAEFVAMVNRCNKVGVRIIVDAVLNHMTGVNQKNGVGGVGSSGGSDFDATDGVESFPAVPYTSADFHDKQCHGNIPDSAYKNSPQQVRECRLVGLLDLDQSNEEVAPKMVAYLNKFIDMGVAGFRLDASKHMWPKDTVKILDAVKDLREDIFGANQRPFVVHEVIDEGGECIQCGEYVNMGRYTDFNYGGAVSAAAKKQRNFKDLGYLGPNFEYGNLHDSDVLVFVDNHDNQRSPNVVTYKTPDSYKLAVGFMLAWAYGYPRVMSGYYFTSNDQGPPSYGASQHFATKSPTFNSDETCAQSSGWVCEHRWPEIRRMTTFRKFTIGTAVTEEFTDDNRIAFARDNRGYFALNNGNGDWRFTKQTTLPKGAYCDVFTGTVQNGVCTGDTINVGADGTATFTVKQGKFTAIHVGARLEGVPPTTAVPSTWKTTVIFLKKQTNLGQNLFLRAGNNANGKCAAGPYQQATDPCAIPVSHSTTVPDFYTEYRMWSQNDNYYDFEGAEETQGTLDGKMAMGTPLAYSTNDKTAAEYQPLNTYGPGYWMVQVEMDCSKTNNGWFEFKGYVDPDGQWEGDIGQSACSGSKGGTAPFSSINHVALCGYINAFQFGSNECVIDNFP